MEAVEDPACPEPKAGGSVRGLLATPGTDIAPHAVARLAAWLTRAEIRLLDELEDDGIVLPTSAASDETAAFVVQELDHVRRPPQHEGRVAVYGAFVLAPGAELVGTTDLIEVIDLDQPVALARRFADGRSTFLVRRPGHVPQLACFRRSVQYEADLVEVQQATGATIVQRTALGVARLFSDHGVVEWNGRSWVTRKHARVLLDSVDRIVDEAPRWILRGILDLCVHWLSPSRIGATLLYDFDPRPGDAPSLDLEAAIDVPRLSVGIRHHYPALYAALMQTDLATLVGPDGTVAHIGVGLRSSIESERAVEQERGMRHRSAARYTWDHHHTVAFVVSEDGPVTVFRHGRPLRVCDATAAVEARAS